MVTYSSSKITFKIRWEDLTPQICQNGYDYMVIHNLHRLQILVTRQEDIKKALQELNIPEYWVKDWNRETAIDQRLC